MPAGNLTQATIGTPVPLCYGYVRVTGMCSAFKTQLSTESNPGLQVGFYHGGEGEWDGCYALFINGLRQFAFDNAGGQVPAAPLSGSLFNFSFHSGCDAPLVGAAANSQSPDAAWGMFPLVTPLAYSRIAYWVIGWTPQTGDTSTMTPVADFRTMRCRLFDANGNQTGYAFTTNPAWHLVDSWLRRVIKPEYNIDPVTGPDALTATEKACFDWGSIVEAATYYDQVLVNGHKRFEGSYAFPGATTLAAMHEQMLLCCRSYQQEYAGKIYLRCDKPRPSTFVLTGKHLIPGSFSADDKQVHANPNRYVSNFLELELPAISQIATIVRDSTTVITTVDPNPVAAGDFIMVGGVDQPALDGGYSVSSVAGNVITCSNGGTHLAGTGGALGYLESRFSQRSPETTPHLQHQLATGQVLPPGTAGKRLKRTKVTYDFASSTWDQANRLITYEKLRDLGADLSSYQPPMQVTLQAWSEAVDAAGNALKQQQPGDRITLDWTAFYEYAGDYEILERKLALFTPNQSGAASGGTIDLLLRTYSEACMVDASDAATASYATVPGSGIYNGSGGGPGGGTGGSGGGGTGLWHLIAGEVAYDAPDTDLPPGQTHPIHVVWSGLQAMAGTTLLTYPDGELSGFTNAAYMMIVHDPLLAGGMSPTVVLSATLPSGSQLIANFFLPRPPAAAITYAHRRIIASWP